jgi:isoquinoline 1-oxidoreductase subunit beta
VAAVDCGRVVNPNLVRQQIEGSLLHALDLATTPAPRFVAGMPVVRPLGALGLRRLGGIPRIEVELVASSGASGTGRRLRDLPFDLAAA